MLLVGSCDMKQLLKTLYISLVIYCVMVLYIEIIQSPPTSHSWKENDYLSYIMIGWSYFKYPLLILIGYFVYHIRLISRLNKSNLFTSLDLLILGAVFSNICFWYNREIYIVQTLIFVCIFYFIWLVRRFTVEKPSTDTGKILYEDKPAEVDELDRELIAKELSLTIRDSQVEGTFVFAITASWGSGKTTLMGFIQQRLSEEKNIVTINFDPWYFNTQEALISSFFDTIYNKLNEEKLLSSYAFLFSKYSNLIGGKETVATKIAGLVDRYAGRIDLLKVQLEECLVKSNKRVVIFIDNIDRLDKEELFLLFKLIRLCSDFSNIFFVLLYDKKQVLQRLKDENDEQFAAKYLEKIIQAEIALPIPDTIAIRKYWERLLYKNVGHIVSSLNSDEEIRWNQALEFMSNLILNLRNVKLHINWIALKLATYERNKMNFVDFFVLETIAHFQPVLYESIFKHKRHLPYYAPYDGTLLFMEGKDKINEFRKEVLARIIPQSENPQEDALRGLMGVIFTSVRHYIRDMTPLWGGDASGINYYKLTPIDDYRYFDAYFSYLPTNQLSFATDLNDALHSITNNNMTVEESTCQLTAVINKALEKDLMDDLIIQLGTNISTFNLNVYQPMVRAFYQNSMRFSHDWNFMSIAQHSRSKGLIARLLSNCKDSSLCQKIMEELVTECKELDFIRGVLDSLKKLDSLPEVNLDEIKRIFARRLNFIIDSKHNVFVPSEQFRDFWSLLDNCSHERVSIYLHDLLTNNIESLPDFMNLMVDKTISSLTGIKYEFSTRQYKTYEPLISEEELRSFINQYIEKHSEEAWPLSIRLYFEVVGSGHGQSNSKQDSEH